MHYIGFLFVLASLAYSGTPGTDIVPQVILPTVSITGTFLQDTDQREVFFSLQAAANVLFRTFSYAGGVNGAGTTIPRGGFDTTLSLFDAAGRLLTSNEDGGCGNVTADAVTGLCWDAYLSLSLPAGNYRLVLTQSTNTANGPSFADGFHSFCSSADQNGGNCTQNFTPNPASQPVGFWDESRNQRVGNYAVDLSGVTIASTPSITTSATLPDGIVGQAYPPFTFTAQPAGSYVWSIVGGTLPPGLTLDSLTGVLSGAITAAGTFVFTIQATDGVQVLQQTVTLTAARLFFPVTLSGITLPPGIVGKAYGPYQVSASGGSGSYSWSASNLPPGLTISPLGQITGIPTSAGIFTSITITVFDLTTGSSANSGLLTATITGNILTIGGSGISEIVLGAGVSAAFTVTGGTAPYTWSAIGLPVGVSINPATGVLSGAPTQAGSFNATITVTDSQTPRNTASFSFFLQVFGFTGSFGVQNASVGSLFSQTLNAAGGGAPYTFAASGLPLGLTLSGGVLSGIPTVAGTYVINIQVTDVNGFVVTTQETLIVTDSGPLTLAGGALPGGTVAALYSQSLSSSGGTAPLNWSIIGGILPGGLSLASTGILSGAPLKAGSYIFSAQVTDSQGVSAAGTFTILIAGQPLTISGLNVASGILGSDYPPQILTGNGGTPPYAFSYSGTLPPGLSFSNGQLKGIPSASGSFSVQITLTDSGSPAVSITLPMLIVIDPSNIDLILSEGSISFVLTAAASGVPTPENVTIRSSDVNQLLAYSVTVTPAVSWLDVSGSGATTPASITFALNPSALTLSASPVPLSTSVVVTCLAPSPCAGKRHAISVSLAVTNPAPQLIFTSGIVDFTSTLSSTQTLSQSVGLQNIGSGPSPIISVNAADSWLSVTGVPNSVAGGPAVSLTFTANPAGLGVGFYRTFVTATSTTGTAGVPVTLSITAVTSPLLSTNGAQYQAVVGSSPGDNQGSFQTIGVQSPTSVAVTSGNSWLFLGSGPAGGLTNFASGQVISYTIDRAGAGALPPGTYYGTIQVVSPASLQTFQVVLVIVPAGALQIPDPEPGGLIFTTSGAGTPASQVVTVYSSSTSATPYSAAVATSNGGTWLTLSSSVGTSSVSNPGISTISVNPGTLPPGMYQGTVSYQFSAAAVRTVNITMIVSPSGTNCIARRLVPTFTGTVTNFAISVGLPTPISVNVLQDCGIAAGNAQVTATFSNGDPPLALQLVDAIAGLYAGTWTPLTSSPQVTVTATATASSLSTASALITGQVASSTVPVLTPGGEVHIYNSLIGNAVAPGTILSIYGSNLAAIPVANSASTLPTVLGATSVKIGGILAPLYYVSPTQINVEVPLELATGQKYEVIVSVGGALSTAGSIAVVAASPGVAAYPDGRIIAQHADYSLVSTTSPAKPGEYIIIYLAGLGLTDNAVADGAPSPSNPLARPLIAPVLTINGNTVPIAFAGLTPTFVGLYQINFQMPLGVPNGSAALLVSQAGNPSNSTILPVRN